MNVTFFLSLCWCFFQPIPLTGPSGTDEFQYDSVSRCFANTCRFLQQVFSAQMLFKSNLPPEWLHPKRRHHLWNSIVWSCSQHTCTTAVDTWRDTSWSVANAFSLVWVLLKDGPDIYIRQTIGYRRLISCPLENHRRPGSPLTFILSCLARHYHPATCVAHMGFDDGTAGVACSALNFSR